MLPRELVGGSNNKNIFTFPKNAGEAVIDLLRETQIKFGKTVVIVTNDLKVASRADRIIRISDGKVNKDNCF